jgi:hypothetical protein
MRCNKHINLFLKIDIFITSYLLLLHHTLLLCKKKYHNCQVNRFNDTKCISAKFFRYCQKRRLKVERFNKREENPLFSKNASIKN